MSQQQKKDSKQKSNWPMFLAGVFAGGYGVFAFLAHRLDPEYKMMDIQAEMLEKMVPVVRAYAPPEVYAEIQKDAEFHKIAFETQFGPFKEDE